MGRRQPLPHPHPRTRTGPAVAQQLRCSSRPRPNLVASLPPFTRPSTSATCAAAPTADSACSRPAAPLVGRHSELRCCACAAVRAAQRRQRGRACSTRELPRLLPPPSSPLSSVGAHHALPAYGVRAMQCVPLLFAINLRLDTSKYAHSTDMSINKTYAYPFCLCKEARESRVTV